MEWSAGGRLLEERLQELETALHNYFGAVNELAMDHPGLNVEVPEKPQALVLYQQCKSLGFHLVEGGLVDQPHIWLQEVAVVADIEALYDMLRRRADASS